MEIHVVVRPTAGFPREDVGNATVVRAYSEAEVAAKVHKLSSFAGLGAKVVSVTLDEVPAGYLENAARLGVTFEATPAAAALPKDWPELVRKMWTCVRQHDNTLPDEALALMKDILLAPSPALRQG